MIGRERKGENSNLGANARNQQLLGHFNPEIYYYQLYFLFMFEMPS